MNDFDFKAATLVTPVKTAAMDVAYCFDRNYEELFGVSLTSLLYSNPQVRFSVHCLCDGISEHCLAALRLTASRFECEIKIYDVARQLEEMDLPVFSHFTRAMYAKIFIPEIVQGVSDRVLYLDCDTLVTGPVAELARMRFGGYSLAAAQDLAYSLWAARCRLEDYFNSGVLLFDVLAWKKQGLAMRCVDLAKSIVSGGGAFYGDQDLLNLVSKGRYLRLDPAYNNGVFPGEGIHLGGNFIKSLPVTVSTKIIHFLATPKPSSAEYGGEHKKIYDAFHSLSAWGSILRERV